MKQELCKKKAIKFSLEKGICYVTVVKVLDCHFVMEAIDVMQSVISSQAPMKAQLIKIYISVVVEKMKLYKSVAI